MVLGDGLAAAEEPNAGPEGKRAGFFELLALGLVDLGGKGVLDCEIFNGQD